MDTNDMLRKLSTPLGMGAAKTRFLADNAKALGLEMRVIEGKTMQPTLILPFTAAPPLPKVHRRS